MSIDTRTVQNVARLARLQLSPEELDPCAEQLSRILTLMETLNGLPTEGVEPMSHAVDIRLPEREDQVCNGDQREALLACAPDTEQYHFRVPKIIE
ncbi:MAG: Asp-tRNA(Asn)/Glu-tRNA(Gln) amidotransferase subunit GatC [Magnetococcales bacterium]|nr:Asp-tRNA(Asn)/Glu-tRNA(Gln) amidotransferase subunit GatC [Magnetococcales bacterium]